MEGERAVSELIPHRERVVRLFVQENLNEKYALILQNIPEDRVVMVSEKAMKFLSDTEHPQGIAAVVSMKEWSLNDVKPGLWLLLDRIADPGNLGTMIRSCWALNGEGILLTGGSVDPYSPKVCRSSMGGVVNLPIVSNIGGTELDFLIKRGFRLLGTAASAHQAYYEADLTGSVLLMVGSEAHGLDPLLAEMSHELIRIPMKEGVNSLNAASACAIIIGEAKRQRDASSLS